MKKLMLGLMVAFAVTAEAEVTIDGLKYELNTQNKTATLTGYTGSPTVVNVSTVTSGNETYTVTSIGEGAFYGCSKLTSLSLPEAASIGESAFRSCSSLAQIEMPKATSIGGWAFDGCSKLTSLSLPEAASIGASASEDCSKLAQIEMPKVTSIGKYAFWSCSSLTSLSLPEAASIGEGAFYDCDSLQTVTVKNYEMKSALESNRSYYGLDGGVTVINASAVKVGDILYEFDADSDTAIIVGYEGSLTTVDANTVDYQGKTYTITSVGINAFKNCSSMTEISLTNATSVGQGAFSGCSSLSVIFVTKQMKQTLAGNRSRYGIGNNVKIICPPTLTEDQVKNAQYDVKEADVKTEVEVTVITPASVTLKSGGETINESDYENDCWYYGVTPQTKPDEPYTPTADDFKVVSKDAPIVEPDEIAVKKESIAAPSAGTVKVENNTVQLGVTVLKTSDLTVEKKNWNKVKITKDNIDVDADGNIIVNVPVDSASGFMILQSKDAKIGE